MKTYKKVSKKFLNEVIHDLIGIIHDYREENEKLRRLVEGMRVCNDDSADAQECPLYDSDEEYRCAMDRLMAELGLDHE